MPNEKQKISFHLATSGDAVEIVNFHNSYYGTKRRPEDWMWEYKTYNAGKAVAAFARDSEKIIATQGMIPIYMEIGNKVVLSGKSENTLALPAYRGTQIMQNLYEFAVGHCINNGMQFIWGFTGAQKAFQRFGFNTYSGIQIMTRPGDFYIGMSMRLKHKSPLCHRIRSVAKYILRYFAVKKRRVHDQCQKKANYELRKGRCDEVLLKEMYGRLRLKFKDLISLKYNQTYLTWRVYEHPFIKYDIYQVFGGPALKAYAIVTFFEGVVSISDITTEDRYATYILLDAVLRDYGRKAGEFRFFGNTKDVAAQVVFEELRQFYFSFNDSWYYVLRDLSEGDNSQIFSMRNWHINGLWTEGYSM